MVLNLGVFVEPVDVLVVVATVWWWWLKTVVVDGGGELLLLLLLLRCVPFYEVANNCRGRRGCDGFVGVGVVVIVVVATSRRYRLINSTINWTKTTSHGLKRPPFCHN